MPLGILVMFSQCYDLKTRYGLLPPRSLSIVHCVSLKIVKYGKPQPVAKRTMGWWKIWTMYSWLHIWIIPGIWSFCLVVAMCCFNHFWTCSALYSYLLIWCQKGLSVQTCTHKQQKNCSKRLFSDKKQEELNNQIKQLKQIFGMDKMQYSSLQCCLSFEEDFFLLGRNACLINKNKFKYSQVTLTPK